MKVTRKIIQIDEDKCDGCGACETDCAEGALKVIDGKAQVVNDVFCDGLGACIGACPTGALEIVEREAEEFDESAVEQHLANLHKPNAAPPAPGPAARGRPASPTLAHTPRPLGGHGGHAGHGGGCPGSALRMFGDGPTPAAAAPGVRPAPAPSAAPAGGWNAPTQPRSELTQWPIQLRLLPTSGPLYQNRDLLLLADCTAAAYPDLQRGLVAGKTVLMSCPKLDDPEESVDKLSVIFRNPIKSVSVAIMEVPCCSGLVRITQEAMRRAGASFPLEVVRIGVRGDLLERFSF